MSITNAAHETTCTITELRDQTLSIPAVRVLVTPPSGPTINVPLGLRPLVIGKSETCDIVVPDRGVSHKHCELSLTTRGVVLRDLKSKNGTSVRGVLITEAILPVDTRAEIGGSTLSVQIVGSPSTVALSPSGRLGQAIGKSLAMRALFATLEKAASTSATILLTGERGTGKKTLAEAIHEASGRGEGPYIVFDCRAASPSAMEVSLFGCAPGVTATAPEGRPGLLEQSDGGTLYINEPTEIPPNVQRALLSAIESGKTCRVGSFVRTGFNTRIITGTQEDLSLAAARGKLSADLLARLSMVDEPVLPLRQRKEDIQPLVEHFLAHLEPRASLSDMPAATVELLEGHSWPGNVRELRDTVERIAVYPLIGRELLQVLMNPRLGGQHALSALSSMTLRAARAVVVEEFERQYLRLTLDQYNGHVTNAAKAMDISRQMLHRMLAEYGIPTKAR